MLPIAACNTLVLLCDCVFSPPNSSTAFKLSQIIGPSLQLISAVASRCSPAEVFLKPYLQGPFHWRWQGQNLPTLSACKACALTSRAQSPLSCREKKICWMCTHSHRDKSITSPSCYISRFFSLCSDASGVGRYRQPSLEGDRAAIGSDLTKSV